MLLPLAAVPVHAQVPVVMAAPAPVEAPAAASTPVAQEVVKAKKRPLMEVVIANPEEQPAAPVASGWGNISGVVQDPSGARVPGAKVTLKGADGTGDLTATTDAVGAYQFNALPAGKYTLEVVAPGFKRFSRGALQVPANDVLTVNPGLEVGSVTEAVRVTAARPAFVPTPAVESPVFYGIRVGGNVSAAMILRKVAPIYPQDQREQGISGVVHIAAIIGKDGHMTEIRALGGPSGLINAAMQAAAQWVFKPAMLNGVPVAVETNIDISFELQ
jgi:TonB family protein